MGLNELDTAYDVIADATRRAVHAGRATGDHDPMKVVDYVIGCMLARLDAKIGARTAPQQRIVFTSAQLEIAARMRGEGAYWHEIAAVFGVVDDDDVKSARMYLAKRLGHLVRGSTWWSDSNAAHRERGESLDDYRARVQR